MFAVAPPGPPASLQSSLLAEYSPASLSAWALVWPLGHCPTPCDLPVTGSASLSRPRCPRPSSEAPAVGCAHLPTRRCTSLVFLKPPPLPLKASRSHLSGHERQSMHWPPHLSNLPHIGCSRSVWESLDTQGSTMPPPSSQPPPPAEPGLRASLLTFARAAPAARCTLLNPSQIHSVHCLPVPSGPGLISASSR